MERKRANRVYTGELAITLAAGAAGFSDFAINSPGRTMQIMSIFYSLIISNNTDGLILNAEDNTYSQSLNVGSAAAASKIGHIFQNVGGSALINTGDYFRMNKPMKQVLFDSFYVRETLPFYFNCQNNTAAKNYTFQALIVCEVNEKIIYQ